MAKCNFEAFVLLIDTHFPILVYKVLPISSSLLMILDTGVK